jgi:hypothetical protein
VPGPASLDGLARRLRERGLDAECRRFGRWPGLIARNPLVTGSDPRMPSPGLAQSVVLARDQAGTPVFAWLFDGAERGTWEPCPLGPADDVEAAARAIARVLATASAAEPEPAAAPELAADRQDSR